MSTTDPPVTGAPDYPPNHSAPAGEGKASPRDPAAAFTSHPAAPLKAGSTKALASAPAAAIDPQKMAGRLAAMDRALIGLLLALAFLLAFFPIRNSDLFQHLAAGRLLTQGAYHPWSGQDPFTWTSAPSSWANSLTGQKVVWVNHAWGFDLLVYLLYRLDPDGKLLTVVRALLIVAVAVCMLCPAAGLGNACWFRSSAWALPW